MFKFKKLNQLASMPIMSTSGSAGYDFKAMKSVMIMDGQTAKIPTGIQVSGLDINQHIQIHPRSSHFVKGIDAKGIIDSDYDGEIFIMMSNNSGQNIQFSPRDKIAQGIVVHHVVNDMYRQDIPRNGGFGSTDSQ